MHLSPSQRLDRPGPLLGCRERRERVGRKGGGESHFYLLPCQLELTVPPQPFSRTSTHYQPRHCRRALLSPPPHMVLSAPRLPPLHHNRSSSRRVTSEGTVWPSFCLELGGGGGGAASIFKKATFHPAWGAGSGTSPTRPRDIQKDVGFHVATS